MSGLIRKREVVIHSVVIIRAFGVRVFVRCLLARRGATFLGILADCSRL
jgi:hypothetical protein